MNDTIFEESIDRVKAKAFDALADQNVELRKENTRLQKIIDAHLEDCDMCEGSGKRKYNAVYVDGDLYQDGEVLDCDDCSGTKRKEVFNDLAIIQKQRSYFRRCDFNCNHSRP